MWCPSLSNSTGYCGGDRITYLAGIMKCDVRWNEPVFCLSQTILVPTHRPRIDRRPSLAWTDPKFWTVFRSTLRVGALFDCPTTGQCFWYHPRTCNFRRSWALFFNYFGRLAVHGSVHWAVMKFKQGLVQKKKWREGLQMRLLPSGNIMYP